MPKAKKPKYKIGQPVVCWDIYADQHERGQVAILGGIIDIDTDAKNGIKYYIMWTDNEEDWFTEPEVELYVKQSITGKLET